MLGGLAADFLGWRVPFFLLTVGFVAVSVLLISVQRQLPARALAVSPAEGHAVARMLGEFGVLSH